MSHELLTVAETARADAAAAALGRGPGDLMRRAGAAVAAEARALAPPGAMIGVLCGPGGNGGDGFVAAGDLAAAGLAVRLWLHGERPRLEGEAGAAAARFAGAIEPAGRFDPAGCGLVVDALFGAGLSREVAGEARAAIERLNAWRRQGGVTLAVDLPSGVAGDSGAVRGAAVEADVSVTFFRFKPGHFLGAGRRLGGRRVLADIGIPQAVLDEIRPRTHLTAPALFADAMPGLRPDGHKYDRGHVLVVSGGLLHGGAARLAARAALRIGAGLVTIAAPAEALGAHAAQLNAIMLARCEGAGDLARLLSDRRRNALVLGPAAGVGEATRAMVATGLEGGSRAVVLDADALTSFAGDALALKALVAPGAAVVATPHAGEFARLFSNLPEIADAGSKLDAARRAAAFLGAVIVLKGADSVIAAPDGEAAILDVDAPGLATAGSGDVLSGMIGGLMARGMAPFSAAAAAVRLHADCARAFGPGLIAEDLPETLPGVLREFVAA